MKMTAWEGHNDNIYEFHTKKDAVQKLYQFAQMNALFKKEYGVVECFFRNTNGYLDYYYVIKDITNVKDRYSCSVLTADGHYTDHGFIIERVSFSN